MLQQTIIWGVFCLALLGLCIWRPNAGRVVIGVFFLIMAVGVNVVFVLVAPDQFVGLGADSPLLSAYEWVFVNVVAEAPAVFGLLAAAFEIAVSVLMISGGRRAAWGLAGGIVFLVAITPLSPWTLPNLILAAALVVVLLKRRSASREAVPAT
jgi:hypothetical protein